MFKQIPGEAVVLRAGGVFRVAELYSYQFKDEVAGGGEVRVLATYGSGFIGLRREGATTKPKVQWCDITLQGRTYRYTKMGHMALVV